MGTNQGQLVVYECPRTPAGEKPQAKLLSTKKVRWFTDWTKIVSIDLTPASFLPQDFLMNGKKAQITQLLVVPEFEVLLSLADNMVYVHDLKQYSLLTSLETTKGATLFAADVQIRGNVSADTHPRSAARNAPREVLVLRLAVVVKKKIICYEWLGDSKDKTFHAMGNQVRKRTRKRLQAETGLWRSDSLCF